jgi:hypothetical protein
VGVTAIGPSNPRNWNSPLRGPWLTSVLGAVLLVGLPVMIVTGLLSYAAPASCRTPP